VTGITAWVEAAVGVSIPIICVPVGVSIVIGWVLTAIVGLVRLGTAVDSTAWVFPVTGIEDAAGVTPTEAGVGAAHALSKINNNADTKYFFIT
jgi:hypothetical protein